MQNNDTGPHQNGNGNSNGNGNGHANGNGHGVFGLIAKTDPDVIAVLEARRAARSDERLTTSMKACFDEIADRALNPAFYDVKGIVAISDTVLAEIFGVDPRTVYTWKYRLSGCGYLWMGKKFKTNMWPLTIYHLCALHKAPRLTKTDSDGTYGAGKFRPAPVNPGVGARKQGQPSLPLPGSRAVGPDGKSEEMLAISGESRSFVPLSPDVNVGSEPTPMSGESRRECRVRADANVGREPTPMSGESRQIRPVTPDAGVRHMKAKALRVGVSEGSFKRSTGLNALKVLPGRTKTSAENAFLLEVGAMMERWRKGSSKAELTGSGVWWRLTFRQDSDLMNRVLAETLMLIKEGRIKTTPGQTAVDLAKRWGVKPVSA